jgi:hypothetical protein
MTARMSTGLSLDLLRLEECSGADGWAAERARRLSLQALHHALQKTTEVLATELGHPAAVAPDWSPTEWAVAQAVAAIHGVSGLLADALRWRGPSGWVQFLAEQKAHTAGRFRRMQQLLQHLDGAARDAGIGFIPLKGAALHASGVYTPGERPMADLDLLVRKEESQRAVQMLGALGFHETYRTWRHLVFEQPGSGVPVALGEHVSNGIKIELHCEIRDVLPVHDLDLSELVFPARPQPGLNAYPSRVALLMHLLMHAAGTMSFRELRLLQLHDVARLSASMKEEDWEQVLRERAHMRDGTLWWAFPPLTLAARYYACIPERVLARVAQDCHWLLKRSYRRRSLAEASLSHLWVSAFPGLAWSRSPHEALAYVVSRLAPSAETLHLRKAFATVQPQVSGGPWAQLSQGQRLIRWLLARQPRHDTLQPVRAALRDAH